MEIIDFSKEKSLVSQYMAELRDTSIQQDRMRFRRNLERIGEIMAYEISKRVNYELTDVTTPLGTAKCHTIADDIVLATILRAGLPFHNGFLNYFDKAQNAFVSAYRKYRQSSDRFDIHIEIHRMSSHNWENNYHCRPYACYRLFDGTVLPSTAHQRQTGPHSCGIGHSFSTSDRFRQIAFPGRKNYHLGWSRGS